MRGTVAKKLRRQAEKETQGYSKSVTKQKYKKLKKAYKENKQGLL